MTSWPAGSQLYGRLIQMPRPRCCRAAISAIRLSWPTSKKRKILSSSEFLTGNARWIPDRNSDEVRLLHVMALQRSGILQTPSNATDKPGLHSSGESEKSLTKPDITTTIFCLSSSCQCAAAAAAAAAALQRNLSGAWLHRTDARLSKFHVLQVSGTPSFRSTAARSGGLPLRWLCTRMLNTAALILPQLHPP